MAQFDLNQINTILLAAGAGCIVFWAKRFINRTDNKLDDITRKVNEICIIAKVNRAKGEVNCMAIEKLDGKTEKIDNKVNEALRQANVIIKERNSYEAPHDVRMDMGRHPI